MVAQTKRAASITLTAPDSILCHGLLFFNNFDATAVEQRKIYKVNYSIPVKVGAVAPIRSTTAGQSATASDAEFYYYPSTFK